MNKILNNKKLLFYVIVSVLTLSIASFMCFSGKTLSISYYDALAESYGTGGIRVHNTDEFINQYEFLMNNKKSGIYHLISDPSVDSIDNSRIESWIKSKYVLNDFNRNYYTYKEKGIFEPFRFYLYDNVSFDGDFALELTNFRTTDERLQKAEFVGSRLKQKMDADSNFKKIYNIYKYIKLSTRYNGDPTPHDLLNSNTDIYSVLIDKYSVCIGYSIAFSYLMDLYGINSYVVDEITSVDPYTKSVASIHTYNVVELNGKYYVVDTTGGIFLGKVKNGAIRGGTLNISTSDYIPTIDERNYMNNTIIDKDCMNSVISQAKQLNFQRTTACAGTSRTIDYSKVEYGNKKTYNNTSITSKRKIDKFIDNVTSGEEIAQSNNDDSSRNVIIYPTNDGNDIQTTSVTTTIVSDREVTTSIKNTTSDSKEKGSNIFKLYIIIVCVVMLISIIIFETVKFIRMKKGKGYTTFTFYVDK